MVAEMLVPEHLKWRVLVRHIFERKMRHQVFVVNHPVQSVNSGSNILSHCLVADPWTSKTMNLHLLVEFSLQSHPCYFRKSSPHTVPSCQDRCTAVFLKQLLYSFVDLVFNETIILEETLVDPAIFAAILHFFKVEILYPISGIGRSSKRHNYHILYFLIAHIGRCHGYQVGDMGNLSEMCQISSTLAIPFLQTSFPTICQASVVCVFFGGGWVVAICVFEGEAECGGCEEEDEKDRIFDHKLLWQKAKYPY